MRLWQRADDCTNLVGEALTAAGWQQHPTIVEASIQLTRANIAESAERPIACRIFLTYNTGPRFEYVHEPMLQVQAPLHVSKSELHEAQQISQLAYQDEHLKKHCHKSNYVNDLLRKGSWYR